MGNAVKYNRSGGEVRLYCETPYVGVLRLVVADTGIGIAPEDREQLFTPFARLGAEETDIEGTGLGLALTKHLVEAMRATIGVDSEQGVGSTFWVDLPETDSVAARQPVDAHAPPPPRPAGTPRTILFIEDNQANVRQMRDILSRRPEVSLAVAMTGAAGLDLAREQEPCLVFLDLNLPDMNGRDVLRRLRGDHRTRSIPVVVSADATPGQAEQLLGHGAAGYVTKPFAIDRILAVVDETDHPGNPPTQEPEPGAEPGPEPASAPSAGQAGNTVLYIEDDESNRKLMTVLFARELPNLDLVVAPRVTEGLAMAAALRPCLILLDGQLPDMTGAEVAAALRSHPTTGAIPIVIVSGRPPTGEATDIAAHLVKPFQAAELRQVVHQVLDGTPDL